MKGRIKLMNWKKGSILGVALNKNNELMMDLCSCPGSRLTLVCECDSIIAISLFYFILAIYC
jgi:hypothetical protein